MHVVGIQLIFQAGPKTRLATAERMMGEGGSTTTGQTGAANSPQTSATGRRLRNTSPAERCRLRAAFRVVSNGNVTGKVTLGSRIKRHIDRTCCTGRKARTTRIALGKRDCHSNPNNAESCRTSVAQRDGVPSAGCVDNLIAERNAGDG
jgi:hypothetical protein